MALVVQYIPDPPKAMSEICRVVKRGGTIAAYVWSGSNVGHPQQPMIEALKLMGTEQRRPPGDQMRSIEALVDLFGASGLKEFDSRTIEFQLNFRNFDEYWNSQAPLALGRSNPNMNDEDIEGLKSSL